MFGLSLTHLILFGVIALIFIGPDQLPEVARTLGRILTELRRATADFQNQFTGQFRDQTQSFNELRQQLTNLEKEGPVQHPEEAPYSHGHQEGGGHGPEAFQGHAEAAAVAEPAPELPVGAHPVSEDDKGKKS